MKGFLLLLIWCLLLNQFTLFLCSSCYKSYSYNTKHTVEISATDFKDFDKNEESTYTFPFLNCQWNERNNLKNNMGKNDCPGRNFNLPCNHSKLPTVSKHDKITSNEIRKKKITYKRDSTLYLEMKELETVEDFLPNLSWYKKKKSTRTGVSTLGSKVASLLNKIYKQKKISTKKQKKVSKSSYPLYKPITPIKILLVPLLPKHTPSSSHNSKLPRMIKSLKNRKKVSVLANFKASIMQALLSDTSRNAQAKVMLQNTEDPSSYNSVTHLPQMNINKTPQKQIKSNKEKQILSSTTSAVLKTEIKLFSNTSMFQKQEKINHFVNDTSSTDSKPNITSMLNNSIINSIEPSIYSEQEKQILNLTTSATPKSNGDSFWNTTIFEKLEKLNNFANDASSSAFVTPMVISKPDSISMLVGSDLKMEPTKTLLSSSTPNPTFLFWNATEKLIKHITDDKSSEEYDYIQTRKKCEIDCDK